MAQGRNLFQQLEIEAFRAGITPRTKQSIEWFRRKASQLGKVSIPDVMDEVLTTSNSGIFNGKLSLPDSSVTVILQLVYFPSPKFEKLNILLFPFNAL